MRVSKLTIAVQFLSQRSTFLSKIVKYVEIFTANTPNCVFITSIKVQRPLENSAKSK